MRLKVSVLSLVVLFTATVTNAQDIFVLKADRMLDVTTGRIVSNATIVVENGMIRSVGNSNVPRNAEVIDLGNMTLLPGLMDMHTHLTSGLSAGSFTRAVTALPADAAFVAAQNAEITLMAGFTTVRNVGSSGFVDVSLMKAIDKDLVIGPSVFPAGHSLGITGGHCDETGFAPGILEGSIERGIADGVDEVIKAVRYQIKHGAKVIKTCATAGVLSFEKSVGAQQYSYEELKAMVEEAGRHGIKVAAHAHGTEGIIAAVKAGVASIEHGSVLNDEAISLMKQHGTYLVADNVPGR